MTRKQLLARLQALNIKIDSLILSGKPYTKEAKEHHIILKLLNA